MKFRAVRFAIPLVLLLSAVLLAGCAGRGWETTSVQGFVYVSSGWHPRASFGLWVYPDALPGWQLRSMGLVPFSGCVVRVMGTGLMAVCDANGFFILTGVPFGSQSLLFGYGNMSPLVWMISIGRHGVFRGHYHGFMRPGGREGRGYEYRAGGGRRGGGPRGGERGNRGPRGGGERRGGGRDRGEGDDRDGRGGRNQSVRDLLDSHALAEFIRAHEAEPHSGQVLAALVHGTDLATGATTVQAPLQGWEYVSQADKDRAARICDEWNQVVLGARQEAGFEDTVTATIRVCDTSGAVLLTRSAE